MSGAPESPLGMGVYVNSGQTLGIFERSLADLNTRLGVALVPRPSDTDHVAPMWQERRPLYDHLARTAERFWVAEEGGQIVVCARARRNGS